MRFNAWHFVNRAQYLRFYTNQAINHHRFFTEYNTLPTEKSQVFLSEYNKCVPIILFYTPAFHVKKGVALKRPRL